VTDDRTPDPPEPVSFAQARIRAVDAVAIGRLVRLRDELARVRTDSGAKAVDALDVLIEALRTSDPLSDRGRDLRLALAAGTSQSMVLADIEAALGDLRTRET
jgi:hypothetical protein